MCLFVIAWAVVLNLTQQRIQLEGNSKVKTLLSKQTPFIWDFETIDTDIVDPYLKFWNKQEDGTIFAGKDSNPELSLNFSGEKVNSNHYNSIQLISPVNLHGTLK